MKLSEQLREKARRCGTYGMRMSGEISHDETTEWKAADLLEECERALHNAAIYRENADFTLINDTLARLRAQERG